MANATPGDWVGDENHMTCITRQTIMKTRSETQAAAAIKGNEKAVVEGSTHVNLSKKPKAKEVANLANNKKRKWSSKGSFKKYVMPSQDSFDYLSNKMLTLKKLMSMN